MFGVRCGNVMVENEAIDIRFGSTPSPFERNSSGAIGVDDMIDCRAIRGDSRHDNRASIAVVASVEVGNCALYRGNGSVADGACYLSAESDVGSRLIGVLCYISARLDDSRLNNAGH